MTATDAIVLLPVALGSLTVGLLFLPLAWRGGYRRHAAEVAERADIARILGGVADQPEPTPEVEEFGYQGQHRIGDETVRGSTAQRATIRALRSPTAEFEAIVATSYRSGELPIIGQPGKAYLYAHMAAVGNAA